MTAEERAAPKICYGFEVHQPFALNTDFKTEAARGDHFDRFFSPAGRERIEGLAASSYLPAAGILLEWLDEGFACTLALSGVLIEQLERWAPEALAAFQAVGAHPHTELLGETYYHSIAGLFLDMEEFEVQVMQHRDLMRDLFKKEPRVLLENCEFIFHENTIAAARELGFDGLCTEGVDRLMGERSPNYIYSRDGMPILMKNCRLSDDIAVRFCEGYWDQYPLTADKFAHWVSLSPGDCIFVSTELEIFGGHYGSETGIFEFLRWLPASFRDRGVEPAIPAEILRMPAREMADGEMERGASACLNNLLQHSALTALERAGGWIPEKKIWRYLQADDYFHRMAMKSGACGHIQRSCSQQESFDFFTAYMRILSFYEERCARNVKSRKAVRTLRAVPPEKAFHFWSPGRYRGYAAHSLEEFAEMLEYAPEDVIVYHSERQDFSQWIGGVLEDTTLAREVSQCQDREAVIKTVCSRIEHLKNRLR